MEKPKKGVDFTGITVVYFCHDGEGKFIMAKRSENARDEKGCWDIGGGGLEFGELIEDALRREIKEEYCTDVLDYKFLGYRDVRREQDGVSTHWIALDFKVQTDSQKVAIGELHKFDDIGFFTLNTIPKNSHSQFPEFLRRYREKLEKF